MWEINHICRRFWGFPTGFPNLFVPFPRFVRVVDFSRPWNIDRFGIGTDSPWRSVSIACRPPHHTCAVFLGSAGRVNTNCLRFLMLRRATRTERKNVDNQRRKFRSQTSDHMDRWKAKVVRVKEEKRREEQSTGEERRGEKRGKKIKKEKASEERRSSARKGSKVAKHCVFQMICGSGGPKSRLAKAAGAVPAGQMRDEELHAVVARSTIRSQNSLKPKGGLDC